MEFKISRLFLVIKWLVESDGDSEWNHADEGDEGDMLYFYGASPKLAPSEIPVEVARIMIQGGWRYILDDNGEHNYVFEI